MKVDQNILDKLEKDILLAQEKLQSINDAINRDQSFCEEKKKDIKLLEKEEKELVNNINILKEKQIEEQMTHNKAKTNYEAVMKKLNEDKLVLQSEIKIINEKMVNEVERLWDMQKKTKKEMEQLSRDYLLEASNTTKKSEELNKQISDLEKEIERLTILYNKEWLKIQSQDDIIEWNKQKIKEQEKDLNNLLSKIIERDNIELEIKRNAEDIQTQQKKLQDLKEELVILSNEKNKLEFDIIKIKEETSWYVQKKLTLNEQAERLAEKEKYIESKYIEAGLTYN